MTPGAEVLGAGLAAMAAAWLLVLGLIRVAPRIGLLDRPNQRSLHTVPKPRGGGIAFVLVTVVAAGVLAARAFAGRGAAGGWLGCYLLGGGFIAAVSLRDDFRSLGAGLRFGCQTAAAVLILAGVGFFRRLGLPVGGPLDLGGLGLGLTVLWIVGLTNVYNFMDGIDGIAGVQGVVAGLGWAWAGLAFGAGEVAILGAVLAGGCGGFLLLNWSPARIFMGDVGSAFLGFSFAAVALGFIRTGNLTESQVARVPLFALLLVWPFVGDGLYTFFRRLRRGEQVWKPHRSHLYQRLVQAGWSHRQASSLYALWCVACALIAGRWLEGRAPGDLLAAVFPVLSLGAVLLLVRAREGRRPPPAAAAVCGALLWWGLAGARGAEPAAAVTLFGAGQPGLGIFVARSAPPLEQGAAADLARVLGRMSGTPFVVGPESSAPAPGIYVGQTQAAAQAGVRLALAVDPFHPAPGTVGPDTFVVRTLPGRLLLVGATPEASWFAVSWLLQHRAGVRWYGPGADGELIPRRSQWSLAALDFQGAPAFFSREIEMGESDDDADWVRWKRHNGLAHHLDYSHALARTFTTAVLAAHPRWSPHFLDGRSAEAADQVQPNLADAGAAAYAAEAAGRALGRSPGELSYSLGINDNVRYDQGSDTQARVTPLRYFRGFPDYSALVFGFMNRAADDLQERSPGHYLGCLAYFWCQDAPAFPVSRAVIPYLAADRGQYYDAAFRREDLALMQRWGRTGVTTFGLWEYGFGTGYLVPREPIMALAEAVRAGWEAGARGYFLEAEPNPGFDAFKVWMVAQLLWEPERPLVELRQDFLAGYYGGAAAPMGEFLRICEEQWMAQALPAKWLKMYQQPDQSGLFPAGACRGLRAVLERARLAVGADDAAAALHVQQASGAFAVTEAYVAFDEERQRLNALESDRTAGGGRAAVTAEQLGHFLDLKAALGVAYARATAGASPAMAGAELTAFLRDDPVPRLLWSEFERGATGPETAPRSQAGWPADWRLIAATRRQWDTPAGRQPINPNPDFALAAAVPAEPRFLFPHSGTLPRDWEIRAMATEDGRVGLVGQGAAGSRTLRVEGAWDTQCYQWLRARPGHPYLAVAKLRGRSSPGGDSALFLRFLDRDGEAVGAVRTQSIPKHSEHSWRVAVVADRAPADAAWVGVGVSAARQGPGDWLEVGGVELRTLGREAPP